MKDFNIFHSLWMSFYSQRLYQEAARSWRGTGFGYLFLLTAFLGVLPLFKIHAGIQVLVHRDAPPIVAQIPTIKISAGKLSTEEARPYTIEDPRTKKVLAIIDTTKSEPPADLGGAMMFVAQTKMAIKRNEAETRIYDLSKFEGLVLNQERIHRWLKVLASWGAVAFFFLVLLLLFPLRIVHALLFSILTNILAKAHGVTLGYSGLLRLTVIAMTPALCLDALVNLFELGVPFLGLVCFLLVIGFIYFAVASTKQSSPEDLPA